MAIRRKSTSRIIPSITPPMNSTTSTGPASNTRVITPTHLGRHYLRLPHQNENGFVGNLAFGTQNHGQRLNQDTYAQQELTLGRLGVIAGGRFVHDSAYGNTGVPRVALTFLAFRGNQAFSGTRLRFSYSTGFKEPRLEETYNGLPGPDIYNIPNPSRSPTASALSKLAFSKVS